LDQHQFASTLTTALDRDGMLLEPETVFREAPGWDSLCVLITIALADEIYGKQLTGRQIATANTVTDLWRVLEGASG